MLLPVKHTNGAGVTTNLNLKISLLQFLKHGVLAGQGPGSTFFPTLTRGIGLILYYQQYINVDSVFNLLGFNRPPSGDPTELGDFSTIVGKAFSDYLAKSLLAAPFTFTYEAALSLAGHPITGVRPDFYCSSPFGQFSIESKGRQASSISAAFMAEAKAQSSTNPLLTVNFSYASVTYDIYETPKCNFEDPENLDIPKDAELHNKLVNAYYQNLIADIEKYSPGTTMRLAQRDFLSYSFESQWGQMKFLIDQEVMSRMRNGDVLRGFDPIESEFFYIDRDGIGISIS